MPKNIRNSIKNKTFAEERALYHLIDTDVINCLFDGEEDGESALKDSVNINVKNSKFALRYPLWHGKNLQITNSEMTNTARAPLWYGEGIVIDSCNINGIKCLRESKNISIRNCKIVSDEFMWKCGHVNITDTDIDGVYSFFEIHDAQLSDVKITGKYTLQYMENVKLNKCILDTKDAFWHSKNVIIKDCVVKGEYLGWYSDGLTFINCEIISHQPLVDCKNLTLVNCTMKGCDLAFEYSDVNAEIIGEIDSIKNPRSGTITVDSVGDLITKDAIMPCRGKVVIRKLGDK